MWEFNSDRIALAREANNVTQAELSALTGIAPQQIGQWERGEVKPGQDSLMKICNALRTPPKFFFVYNANFVKEGVSHAEHH